MKMSNEIDTKHIYKLFTKHKDFFPHIRYDYVKRKLEADEFIYDDGVVILYSKYKRNSRTGNVLMKKGDYIIHQIVNEFPGNGKTSEVFHNFVNNIETDIYLTVRDENARAIRFYEKMGFVKAGEVYWKNGEISGTVFLLTKENYKNGR